MRVFIAGGTGVIGRSLIPLLIAAGHRSSPPPAPRPTAAC